MGLAHGKKLKEHYDTLYNVVVSHLRHEAFKELSKTPGSQLSMIREEALFPGEEVPDELPDVYFLYKKCEKWGLWWDGGVSDQPHLLMTEFMVCSNAEAHFNSTILPYLQELAKPLER